MKKSKNTKTESSILAEPIVRETSADIQQAGLRVTLPRKKILSIFEEHPDAHYSAEDIASILRESDEEVGLATVYRVLAQFEKAGLLIRNVFNDNRAVYELDTGKNHHHMICLCCGHIQEFTDPKIELLQLQIAKEHQFDVIDHVMTLFGTCAQCKEKPCR